MKLSDFLLYLKVNGEAVISVEDAERILSCDIDDEFPDVKTIRIEPLIDPKIYNYYGEKEDNED